MQYTFHTIHSCNMCGSPSRDHRILGRRLNTPQRLRPNRRIGIATTVVQCTRCALIYPNPVPVPERFEDHYGLPPEKYWDASYFDVDGNYFGTELDRFQHLYGGRRRSPLAALDIGAGVGKGMLALQRAGFEAYGIEPSEPFYSHAVGRMGVPPERLQLAAVESAQFAPEQFDFINFGAVLEHLYDPSAAICKAMNWLTPGGLMFIDVPSSGYLMSRLCRWFYRATGAGDYAVNICPMHAPFHIYEFDLKSFQHHAQANGYHVAHYQYGVGVNRSVPRPISFVCDAIMKRTNTGMQLDVWLKKPEPI